MRAFMSGANGARVLLAGFPPNRSLITDAAEREARAILAVTEPFREGGEDHDAWPAVWWMLNPDPKRDTGPERVARKALAESIAAYLEMPDCVTCGAPFDHGCNTAACSEACERPDPDDLPPLTSAYIQAWDHTPGFAPEHPPSESRPFVLESAPLYCGTGRPLRVQRRPPQATIAGTTRPESAPTIRTEGREADGPLFTQETDARARADARSQRDLFGGRK